MSNSFQDIEAWKKAHEFVLTVYRVTKGFPDFEKFGLCSQFQRAAVSIPANIAEGYKKLSRTDKLRFFNIAQGSLEECRYYIILSCDLNYISAEDRKMMEVAIEEVSKTLNGYCKGIIDKDYSTEL